MEFRLKQLIKMDNALDARANEYRVLTGCGVVPEYLRKRQERLNKIIGVTFIFYLLGKVITLLLVSFLMQFMLREVFAVTLDLIPIMALYIVVCHFIGRFKDYGLDNYIPPDKLVDP